jgi:hypothetical protein
LPVKLEQLNGCKAYTLDELQDAWLDAAPILPTPNKSNAGGNNQNGSGVFTSGEYTGPLEIDAELKAMRFKAPAGAPNIHQTQLRITFKMIASGEPVDKVVANVLAATKKAVADDPRCGNWNWAQEEHNITSMCFSAINKAAKRGDDFSHTLPDDLYDKWRAIAERGERPIVFFNRYGASVRTTVRRDDGAAAPAVPEEKAERPTKRSRRSRPSRTPRRYCVRPGALFTGRRRPLPSAVYSTEFCQRKA